jgi:hypothetical protein
VWSYLRHEFLEKPPFLQEELTLLSFEDNHAKACGQMARLVWQLQDDHFLLAERVVDAVVSIRRVADRQLSQSPGRPLQYPLVRLVSLSRKDRRLDLFPWVAVIEASNPEPYKRALGELTDWLGIGVGFSASRSIRPFESCREGFGAVGTIGGILSNGNQEYAVTCSHVLAANCKLVQFRGDPKADSNQPDAALLDRGTPCFNISHPTISSYCLTELQLQDFIQRRRPVVKGFE